MILKYIPAAIIGIAFTSQAIAQSAPAVAVAGTCEGLNFDRALLSSPTRVDLVVKVDESGQAISASALSPVEDSKLLAAALSAAKSCRYQPAIENGRPTTGFARVTYNLGPPPAAQPLAGRPAIVDMNACAPTADDYPKESIRLQEMGTTVVRFSVDQNGHLTAFGVVRSSGYLRLDFTALIKLAGCKFRPGRDSEGRPVGASVDLEYQWRLD